MKDLISMGEMNEGKQIDLKEGLIFCEDPQKDHQVQSFSDDGLRDNRRSDALSSSVEVETCPEETAKAGDIPAGIQDIGVHNNEENRGHATTTSAGLLESGGSGFKLLDGEGIIEPTSESMCAIEPITRLSTEEIMRVAGKRFIQSYSQADDTVPVFGDLSDLSSSGLSSDEIEDIGLADILLASAEKVSNQEYETASKLLDGCDRLSSSTGNPVERVVYYFSEALREKIDRESKGLGRELIFDVPDVLMNPDSAALAHFKDIPFYQIEQFAGIQAIVENMDGAKRIHLIDLCIKSGVQWTHLMQALASRNECPLESLKITAVGPCARQMEGAGKWLMSFAETMNLPFSFKMVTMSGMIDFQEDQFEIDEDETAAVYSEFFIWLMIPQPDRLDSLMRMIRKFNPCMMVIMESESNLNSPDYFNRFIEALFFYSTYFDCLGDCMEKEDPSRLFTESLLSQVIKNIVVAEGEERKARHVKIDCWRAFLSRFGMEETDLSMSILFQADQMVKNFGNGKSYTLDKNGKSLITEWKGTPLHSISVWKFV